MHSPRMPLMMLVLALATGTAAQTPRDDFALVTPSNFDSGGAISRQFHLHAESYKPSATIAHGERERLLGVAPSLELPDITVRFAGDRAPFKDFVERDPYLDSVIVVHRGEIIFERYLRMQPQQRHYAWSVTKVLTSHALSALVGEGLIDMEQSVEHYLPALADSAWAGTRLRDIAHMASGIDCRDSDGYQDSCTCVYRMEESLGITAPTAAPIPFVDNLRGMRRRGPAGELSEYVSANTNVLMLVMEAVTGQSYAHIVSSRLWERMGAEADGLVTISSEGHAYASGGLMARLRDVARLGLDMLQPPYAELQNPMLADLMSGGGIAFTPEQLERLAGSYRDDLPARTGWQWDHVWDDGGMFKGGYLGQGLYVDPRRDLVIAWFGTGIDYSATQTPMNSVARQLARSGLFEPINTQQRQ